MADPFLGQLALVPYTFAPQGWAFCAGQILSISQNTALFSLIGTTFGGNGTSTFALPDLRGRVPVGAGQGPGLQFIDLGESAGEENIPLIHSQVPSHVHLLITGQLSRGQNPISSPTDAFVTTAAANTYGAPTNLSQQFAPNSVSPGGGPVAKPHENRMPVLVLNWIIALVGVFPQRS